MGEKVAIIAFDGMDKDLVQEYDLPNVKMQEFEGIDNSSGINRICTSEEFASFVTGDTPDELGISGMNKREFNNSSIQRLEKFIKDTKIGYKTDGLRTALYKNINKIRYEERPYTEEDYDQETIFDKVERGKGLHVPGYRPEYGWMCGMPLIGLKKGFSADEVAEKSRKETEQRFDDFFNLSFDFWDLIMLQVHDPDHIQHLEPAPYKKDYKRLDKFAKKVKKELPDDWTIIFMSDHGLPNESGIGHNTKAFYSCNRPLFPDKEPHITDFHDRVLELVKGND